MVSWRFIFRTVSIKVTRWLLESFSFIHIGSVSSVYDSCTSLRVVSGFRSIGFGHVSSLVIVVAVTIDKQAEMVEVCR